MFWNTVAHFEQRSSGGKWTVTQATRSEPTKSNRACTQRYDPGEASVDWIGRSSDIVYESYYVVDILAGHYSMKTYAQWFRSQKRSSWSMSRSRSITPPIRTWPIFRSWSSMAPLQRPTLLWTAHAHKYTSSLRQAFKVILELRFPRTHHSTNPSTTYPAIDKAMKCVGLWLLDCWSIWRSYQNV